MFSDIYKLINGSNLEPFFHNLEKLSIKEFAKKNGNKPKWEKCLEDLTSTPKATLFAKNEYLFLANNPPKSSFENLKPWRKGPFAFENFNLDSEWNGFIKWQRLAKKIDFKDKTILDVGCGNGYFALQMSLNGAKLVLGLEPFLLFNYQFQALKNLSNNCQSVVLAPLKLEQIDPSPNFDIVFSMGVLYHAKSPIEHILSLKKMLKKDGELVLETLIVEGVDGYSLTPKDRYAKMRNVWFIPSKLTLINWLNRCGFSKISTIDDNITSINEQRKTEWIGDDSQSLEDFINDGNTIEDYPRPRRLMLKCKL